MNRDNKNHSAGVILKPGKDKPIRQRHHWIFSGAIHHTPSFQNGDLIPVYSADHELLGTAYFNKLSGIRGRMVSFGSIPPLESLQKSLSSALALRKMWFDPSCTNSYRLINGEGDGIPGLVVDVYDQVAVLQSSTQGIDRLIPFIIEWLLENLTLTTVYEKSLLPSRREEGLSERQGLLHGSSIDQVTFKENALTFITSLSKSQKTGFFLDHREMRRWIKELATGKRVLNAFSYTGGFTVYALAGGARMVDSVDISADAIEFAKKNVSLNGLDSQECGFHSHDVFEFLRQETLPYDLVILDPPAFAKKQKDVIAACRGYKDINRLAMQKMPSRSLLLTCSCSHHVNEELFQKVLFQAALEANRMVRIVGRHRLAPDHPVNLFHPESQYLKSYLLEIE